MMSEILAGVPSQRRVLICDEDHRVQHFCCFKMRRAIEDAAVFHRATSWTCIWMPIFVRDFRKATSLKVSSLVTKAVSAAAERSPISRRWTLILYFAVQPSARWETYFASHGLSPCDRPGQSSHTFATFNNNKWVYEEAFDFSNLVYSSEKPCRSCCLH